MFFSYLGRESHEVVVGDGLAIEGHDIIFTYNYNVSLIHKLSSRIPLVSLLVIVVLLYPSPCNSP